MNKKINRSVFYAAGRLLVAGLAALTVLAGSARGQYVSTLISNGLSAPYGVTLDANNNVYIADTVSNCIIRYVPSSSTESIFAGSPGASGTNNGTGAAARFNSPEGIVYAPNRTALVVVDQGNQDLRLLTTGGVVTTPTLTGASLLDPAGIAVANDGTTLYVANQGAGTICMVTSNNVVSTLASTYTYNGNTFHFNRPAAVAVDNVGNIWATDSGNQVVCVVSNGAAYGVAGSYKTIGSANGPASSATFNLPSGLLWDNTKGILVISDTDNDMIRGLYVTNGSYAVETLAGLPTVAGYVDGTLSVAEFFSPFGLATDSIDSGYYVADFKNHAVRVLQPSAPPPPPVPIASPTIGFITFPLVNGTPSATFNPITAPVAIFNNAADLAIEQFDGTVETYMSYGPAGTTITPPGTDTDYANVFTSDDAGAPSAPTLNIPTIPALTLEAISIAPGRPSSPTVSADIEFMTANPIIIGIDAADIELSNVTVGAQMYYVLDTLTNAPTNDGSYGIGPISSGQVLTLNITSNTVLKVRAFTNGFSPSGTVSETLTVSNFIGNQLSFGFASGLASTKYITAPGRTYFAPVTLTELPDTTIYTLQFDLIESGTNFPVGTNNWRFKSLMTMPESNGYVTAIDPAILIPSGSPTNFIGLPTGYITTNDLMELSWITLPGQTNLYPTPTQDLTATSLVQGHGFSEAEGQVVVGAFSFQVPTVNASGNTYTLQAILPSASTFASGSSPGEPTGVLIQAQTNNSLGAGSLNALKNVTVTNSISYLVGDVYPFNWYNAGEFGDNTLQNDDVVTTYESAVGSTQGPYNIPFAASDYFDAMDSAGSAYNLYDGNDNDINSMTNGNGSLDVNDVYVTLRRSLDTNLSWVIRTWSNGVLSTSSAVTFGAQAVSSAAASPISSASPRYIAVAADQVQASGNLSVQVPVRVLAADPTYPIRVMMLNVEIDPLDGSPSITNSISFSTGGNLNGAALSSSQGPNNYAAAWLDSTVAGVSGTNIIGTLSVTLPANVTTNSSYRVHFDHFSASPNGLALFLPTVQDGLITVGNRTGSSWHDGIPDTWRLLWFGTVSNALSAATADPDGDGANNYQEYMAGTNPNDPTSVFKFGGGTMGSGGYTVQWPSVANKHYSIQSSSSLAPGTWTAVATNIVGNGQTMQWTDTSALGNIRFYRATVQ